MPLGRDPNRPPARSTTAPDCRLAAVPARFARYSVKLTPPRSAADPPHTAHALRCPPANPTPPRTAGREPRRDARAARGARDRVAGFATRHARISTRRDGRGGRAFGCARVPPARPSVRAGDLTNLPLYLCCPFRAKGLAGGSASFLTSRTGGRTDTETPAALRFCTAPPVRLPPCACACGGPGLAAWEGGCRVRLLLAVSEAFEYLRAATHA